MKIYLWVVLLLWQGLANGQERRVALIIGASGYEGAPLYSSRNDVRAVKEKVKEWGFEIIEDTVATQQSIENEVKKFGQQMSPNTIALFYYSGHGIQFNGLNYMIPTDRFKAVGIPFIDQEGWEKDFQKNLDQYFVNLNSIMRAMEVGKNKLNLTVFDACRDGQLAKGAVRNKDIYPTGGADFIAPASPRESVVVFSTSAGKPSPGGKKKELSPYTKTFLNVFDPCKEISENFRNINSAYLNDNPTQPLPEYKSNLTKVWQLAACQTLSCQSVKVESVAGNKTSNKANAELDCINGNARLKLHFENDALTIPLLGIDNDYKSIVKYWFYDEKDNELLNGKTGQYLIRGKDPGKARIVEEVFEINQSHLNKLLLYQTRRILIEFTY